MQGDHLEDEHPEPSCKTPRYNKLKNIISLSLSCSLFSCVFCFVPWFERWYQDEMHVVGYFVESPIALLRKIVNIAGSFEHSGREWHTQSPWKSEEASWPEEKSPPRFSLAMLVPLVSLM